MILTGQNKHSPKASVLHVVQGDPRQVTAGMAQTDEPPPYIQGDSAEPPSPVRPVFPAPASSSSQTLAPGGTRNRGDNYLYMKTRHEPINGVIHIDPDLDTVALDKAGVTTIDRRHYNHKHTQKHRHHGRKGFGKKAELSTPNAIFETRQGAIALDLAIVADLKHSHSRAFIQAATKHGSVDINVLGIHARRHLNMEVSTRKGNVKILVPRSFSGYIKLYSRSGDLVCLPNLADAMRLVSRREHEIQVVVGNAVDCLPERGSEWVGDMIHAASRKGKIFVGYIGEDTIPVEEPGFWKKLFQS